MSNLRADFSRDDENEGKIDESAGINNDTKMEFNPHGPWADLNEKGVKDAILTMAHTHYRRHVARNPQAYEFRDFLDALAAAWLEKKAEVDKEAEKYGFVPCKGIADIPEADRQSAALLTLTLNGSFILFGNGCLSSQGGSGYYSKIPLRETTGPTTIYAHYEVTVLEAELEKRMQIASSKSHPFIKNTSALRALYYTKNALSQGDQVKIGKVISASIQQFNESILHCSGETIRNPGRIPMYAPNSSPAVEPVPR